MIISRAIASAFLDGEWREDEMIVRLTLALGVRRPWMRKLARAALRAFPRPPGDARDLLARTLECSTDFAAAARDRLVVRRWPLPEPAMGRTPWPVPTATTLGELARVLGTEIDELTVLADRKSISRESAEHMRHYTYRWVEKRSAGHRLLESPKRRLKQLQRAVLDRILAHVPPHDAAHGFVRERSVVSFARPHVDRPVVIRLDLESFFHSIHAGRAYGAFRTMGYPEEVARALTAICTHRTPADVRAAAPPDKARARSDERLRTPHLPQGSPTSPALANLVAYRLDVRLRALGETYTRYADDLVFSVDRYRESFVTYVRSIVRDEGFVVNARKTRVQRRAQRQVVGGVVVNSHPSIARDELDRLRAVLHNCARGDPEAENRAQHPDFRAHLLGRIAWVEQVNPEKAVRLRRAFEAIRWG